MLSSNTSFSVPDVPAITPSCVLRVQDEFGNPAGFDREQFEIMCGPQQLSDEGDSDTEARARRASSKAQKWTHRSVKSPDAIKITTDDIREKLASGVDAELEGVMENIRRALALDSDVDVTDLHLVKHYIGGFVDIV